MAYVVNITSALNAILPTSLAYYQAVFDLSPKDRLLKT